MKRTISLAALCLASIAAMAIPLLLPAAAAPIRRTPPDSYLHYKVYTVNQLVAQVSANPRVRSAYARTFHIPQSRVVDYMRRNVVESYIPTTRQYTVYCVTSSGRIFTIHQVFRAGTKVFALRNGQPVFKWVCGNPLMSHLPTVKTKVVTERAKPRVITKVSPSVETLTPNQPAAVLIPSESVAMLPTAPTVATTAAGVTTVTGASLFPFWLPLLPVAFPHGGHSSPNATTGGTTTTSTTGGTSTTSGPTTSTTGPTTTTSTTGPTTTTSTTGPTTTTSTTGPSTTTSTTGPSTTSSTSTTGPSTTSSTSTTGPSTTSSTSTTGPVFTTSTTGSTTGPAVPEMSSASSIGLGFIPLGIALLLSVRTRRKKSKV